MIRITRSCFSALTIAAIMLGCGGGGGASGIGPVPVPTPNVPPQVLQVTTQPDELKPNTIAQLSATAVDSDGVVVTYIWAQTAGPAVQLSGAPSFRVSFTVPALGADTQLSFVVQAVDDDGSSSLAFPVSVTVPGIGGAISSALSMILQ